MLSLVFLFAAIGGIIYGLYGTAMGVTQKDGTMSLGAILIGIGGVMLLLGKGLFGLLLMGTGMFLTFGAGGKGPE